MEVKVIKEVNPVPSVVTSRQFKLAIEQFILPNGATLYDVVKMAVASIPDENIKKVFEIEWEYAPTFERNSPSINQIATQIGIKQYQLDEIFKTAVTL